MTNEAIERVERFADFLERCSTLVKGEGYSFNAADLRTLLTLARQSIDAQKRVEGHLCPNCGAFTVAVLNSATAS